MTTNLAEKATLDLHSIKARFLKLNSERIALTRQGLNNRQAYFIDLLPLLFHENNPELIGYINDDVPAGISEYLAEPTALRAAKYYFKTYRPIRRAQRVMDINGLYFMGSSGSIAYNSKSDFDVWLLHSPSLDADAIDLIQQKAHAIEQWAEEELHLEVHFFIFSAEEFKQGIQQGLSTESSGSAQHYLLLDEFYRSSLLIAGKIPGWWLVPPEHEADHNNFIQSLIINNEISATDTIDFGCVVDIPAAEFFGASVWQLYKSIHSPYKSLMKLLLIEVYASEFPSISFLSTLFKQAIYDGVDTLAELDPYLMMYTKIEDYLMTRNQRERLELFRQCFYIKIKEPLSHNISKKTWRRDLFMQVVMDWGWDHEQFALMDAQKEWQIDMIASQRNRLMNALTESYRFLSTFARQNADVSRVSQTELNVLGRKLYAAFERKTGKVDIFNHSNETNINYVKVTIRQKQNKTGQSSWLIYQGHVNLPVSDNCKPLKRTQNAMELIIWAFFNKLIDSHSAISLISSDDLTVKELRQILSSLEEEFPKRELPEADFNDLNQSARIQKAFVFVNVGYMPNVGSNIQRGHVSSIRDNVLSYGGRHNNLAQRFDLMICSSWEELLTFHFEGSDALLYCLCEYLRWAPLANASGPPKLTAYSFSSSYGPSIIRRVEQLSQDLISEYYGKSLPENTRYLIEIEDDYYMFFNEEGFLRQQHIGSTPLLMRSLGKPSQSFSPVLFDQQTQGEPVLQALLKINRPERIQLFYEIDNSMADIYILDENGSLFFQTIPFHDSKALINHFSLFFKATINRRVFLMLDTQTNIDAIEVDFYEIEYSQNKKLNINKIENDIDDNALGFFNIQVIGSPDDEHHSLSIYCGDIEFSLMEHGKELFNVVADHVIQQRASGQKYPIYITDIDISRGLMNQVESEKLQTIHYLNYKKHIEDKLNKAIAVS